MVFWWARYENLTVVQKREFNPQLETENSKRNATLKTCEILSLLSYTWYRLKFRLPALSACRRSCRTSTALQDACFPDSSLSYPLVVEILAVISCCQGRRYGEGRLMLAFWAAKYTISINENYALAVQIAEPFWKEIDKCFSTTRPRHEHILYTPLFVVQSSAVCLPYLLVLCSLMFYGVLNGNGYCSE
jgi:hypothetical protein